MLFILVNKAGSSNDTITQYLIYVHFIDGVAAKVYCIVIHMPNILKMYAKYLNIFFAILLPYFQRQ